MHIKNLKLTSTALTRSLMGFIVLLLLSIWLLGFHAVNAYLIEKKHSMNTITVALQKRIDTYRFVADQLYDNASVNGGPLTPANEVHETRLRSDVFYVEKPHIKTDSLIFGAHEPSTLANAVKMSDYLDVLWGSETNNYSLFYLNGIDNSLTLISTQPLREIAPRFEESYISTLVKSRRTEMLQQANILDERESFSALRKFRFQNDYYFTQCITINQPGHLATIIAFDLPINDIIPLNMARANFSLLSSETTSGVEDDDGPRQTQPVISQVKGATLEITAPFTNAPLNMVYRVPLTSLTIDLLRNNLWLLTIDIVLIALSLLGIYLVRQHFLRPRENMEQALHSHRILSEEVVANLPLGLLVYDFSDNTLVASNKIAEHLLPHLSLQKIANLAESHQGIIQATVNNEVYEIRMFKSQLSPQTYLFQLLDHDKEVLVNKRLQQAQVELNKNHQARRAILSNLQHELNQPLLAINTLADGVLHAANPDERERYLVRLQTESSRLQALFDNLRLLTTLEIQDWQAQAQPFSPAKIIDSLLIARLPAFSRKGLGLFNHYHLPFNQKYIGDAVGFSKIVALLLDYSIISTDYGKITLTVDQDQSKPDQLILTINDTGRGVSDVEMTNLQQPFVSPGPVDYDQKGSALTWFLCNQLCKKMHGGLEIKTKADIGTRYRVHLTLPVEQSETHQDDQEKILEGTQALLDISNEEVRRIISTRLSQLGAQILYPDEHLVTQQHDLFLTDEITRMEDYALLLLADEPGITALTPCRLRVSYNLGGMLLDAMLQLLELRLSQEESDDAAQTALAQDDAGVLEQLSASGYLTLFAETVPDDVKRLYTESAAGDLQALAQTAHRLKGVFAMLNLVSGTLLCETLEQHIKQAIIENDNSKIDNDIQQIDVFVIKLLQHARSLTL
ncbi:phosphotransferase RcsD [Acerihabitans sp. TG2]|uniref:phosphotransferase RcsD n=1 Tax=Acerihabitans sp. TG2 TaxID=3096008 RepID=UPI002B226652|nr:phosphotransferase RcsD [Acerihabitans sp. TG2]MEA9389184.1 phosphotransferase RcsD [Acerihabitans sp. TG2]